MGASNRHPRAFVYRGGVHVAGTVLSCDASVGSDLVFLSHAPLQAARDRRGRARPSGGRRRVLATELTLALLGADGARRRDAALAVVPGRPFSLGGLRLEAFASGFVPGAASLVCERDGRRIVYAGRIGGDADVEVRAADAVCIDARDATPGMAFPSRTDALAAVGRAVRNVLAGGGAPVVTFDGLEASLPVATALAADRIGLRAHRAIVQAAAAFRRAGVDVAVPARFAGRLAPGEVLLWPARERLPARRRGGRALGFVHVSPRGGTTLGLPGAGVTLSLSADFDGLLRYVTATGASEVALLNAASDDLLRTLRDRGVDAYRLGPPRQTDLFAANAA